MKRAVHNPKITCVLFLLSATTNPAAIKVDRYVSEDGSLKDFDLES